MGVYRVYGVYSGITSFYEFIASVEDASDRIRDNPILHIGCAHRICLSAPGLTVCRVKLIEKEVIEVKERRLVDDLQARKVALKPSKTLSISG